ncbi:MAG: hypothetical protein AAF517_03035 [Planctomycetota bacterium]
MRYGELVERLLRNAGAAQALPVLLEALGNSSFEARDHVPIWIALLGQDAAEALPVLNSIKTPSALKVIASQAATWIQTLRDHPKFRGNPNAGPTLGTNTWNQAAVFQIPNLRMVWRS